VKKFSRRARLTLTCTVAVAGLLPALPALASDASDAPAVPAQPSAEAGDIIVTAQRRDETIQSVPMTLQALSGKALGQLNITTFNDLIKYTPNVTQGSSGPAQGIIFMRGLSGGVGATQGSAGISTFPNVALYLDDQSMQFPGRNADVYAADLERVEVLEGPQGTLFGGGAEAGAIRYITNKPIINQLSGHFEGSFGGTAGGAANGSFSATINLPVLRDRLALRATIYDSHEGGYIDNVASSFTRLATDAGSQAVGLIPSATNQSNGGVYNNNALARKNYNPVDYTGGRVEALWDIAPDWNLLVAESYQHLDAQGTFSTYATGSDFQPLGKLQTTTFTPNYNTDTYWNTAWTLNGKVGDWKLVYTGSYMTRHVEQQQDYSNYSRTGGGTYYECTGSATGFGSGATYCYSPITYWHDNIHNAHHSEELRISSPENKRLRVLGGAFYENYKIKDVQRYDYGTIPTCNTALVAAGSGCVGLLQTLPGAPANEPGLQPAGTTFGDDIQRGYRQVAFFGSADFDILPNLTLSGGTRYYNYKEYEVGAQFGTSPAACYNQLICALPGYSSNLGDNKVTYHGFKSRGVITWKPRQGTLVYGLFSQGFRPGGFNRGTSNVLPDQNGTAQFIRPNGYKPDTLTNWEIGLKTDLLDRKVTLNLSAYYMVWENMQLQFFNPDGFGPLAFITNGANFHVKGLEAQLAVRPFAGLSIQSGATYNDSKQVTSPCFISNNPGSATLGQCISTYYNKAASAGGTASPAINPFGTVGSSLPFSPHVQGNIRARYEWQGRGDLGWFVSGGATYTGPMWSQPSTYPSGEGVAIPTTALLRYRMSGYALLDASVGFRHGNWTASLFGNNLTNSHASTFTSSTERVKSEVPVRPLTYGLKVGINF
jgi:outer membrane receptor protein involved in Fe transport